MVDQPVICHGFAVAVGVDRLAEDFGGVLGRRGGQADTAGIEVVEHAAVLRQVLRVVAHGQFAVGHFLVERVTAVGLVDDDTVEGADRWRVIGLENAPDHGLHRGDLHARLIGGAGVVQAIEVVDLRQRLVLLQLHVLHRLGGLGAERGAVDQEQNPVEALGLEQAVDQANHRACLAGAGRHRQQAVACARCQRAFHCLDRALLVVAQVEVGHAFLGQVALGLVAIAGEQIGDVLGRVELLQRAPQIGR